MAYHVLDRLPPFLYTQTRESAGPNVIFEGVLFVRQMTKLHGFYNAVDDHGGTETGAQTQEEHLSTFVAPQSLHSGIIDDFNGTHKRGFEVEPGPPASEVIRIREQSISDDQPGIADRYRVILPVPGELLDARDHLFGSQLGTGWKFPGLFLSGGEDLHVGSAYINNKYIHNEAPRILSPFLSLRSDVQSKSKIRSTKSETNEAKSEISENQNPK